MASREQREVEGGCKEKEAAGNYRRQPARTPAQAEEAEEDIAGQVAGPHPACCKTARDVASASTRSSAVAQISHCEICPNGGRGNSPLEVVGLLSAVIHSSLERAGAVRWGRVR